MAGLTERLTLDLQEKEETIPCMSGNRGRARCAIAAEAN